MDDQTYTLKLPELPAIETTDDDGSKRISVDLRDIALVLGKIADLVADYEAKNNVPLSAPQILRHLSNTWGVDREFIRRAP